MAATYGYGGEFSSDEDIDRLEQQSEGLSAKFGAAAVGATKPSKQQIEEMINTIRQFPVDQEISLSDEYLIGLLDYYRVNRGPVVDSTRKLYKRLAIKRIRDFGQDAVASNGEANITNGNSDNNNSINIIAKKLQSVAQVEPASSDDDEPMPPVSSQSSVEQSNRRKITQTNDKPEPMEVDVERTPITPALADIRTTRQVDISSSEDESDKGSNSGDDSDSEELDITPPKYPAQQQQTKLVTGKVIASTPIKDSVAKISPVTQKDAVKIKSKTPQYTRSQRIATRSSKKSTDVSSSKVDGCQPIAQATNLNKSTLASKFRVKFLISTLLVALLAIFIYHYRNDLTDFSRRILSKTTKIQF